MFQKIFLTESGWRGRRLKPLETITPQPPPTSPRIKHLLGLGLMQPERLNPTQIRELSASVVYHLISQARM